MRSVSIQSGPLSPLERAAIVEEFWASRNAWADSVNAERRLLWERKWAGIGERDLAPDHTRRIEVARPEGQIPSRILVMRRTDEALQENTQLASLPAYRFDWQPKSLHVPAP